jgi:hypothetical protein
VQLLDQALAGADSRSRHELSQRIVDRAKTEADRTIAATATSAYDQIDQARDQLGPGA